MDRVQHTYRCSDPVCAEQSGTYTTTIPPWWFPSCKWCGKLLALIKGAQANEHA